MFEYSDLGLGGVLAAIVIGFTNVIKPITPEKFHPLLSLVIGVVVGGGLTYSKYGNIEAALVAGIVLGLSSAGLYDHKSVIPAPLLGK